MISKFNLSQIAHEAMLENGFMPDLSPEIFKELEEMTCAACACAAAKDLRDKLWVSIDNEDSRDLDQITYAENNTIFIAIADVDSIVKKGSSIDERARQNTTSVYTPTQVFPMLPVKLSTNLTSLNENEERCALVTEIQIEEDGSFNNFSIYPAVVKNKAKLAYPQVGAFLEGNLSKIAPDIHLREQLKLQDSIARKIEKYRENKGTLEFEETELKLVIVDNIPVALQEKERNRAHKLIENFMIAANVATIRFLTEKKIPAIRRIVRTPKRWERIVQVAKENNFELPPKPDPIALRAFLLKEKKERPLQFYDLSLTIIKLLGRGEYVLALPGKPPLGHFDLAEHAYTHATAPNRRYPDLTMQRILKGVHYTEEEIEQIARQCTEKEMLANKIERRLTKCAAAFVMQKDVGKIFQAIVTGVTDKGTWVRLQGPIVEGKLVKGFKGLDVGDSLNVKLIKVDMKNGHIDFVKV